MQAAPSGAQICKKMISDGRGGGLSQAQCECDHRVAEAVLDDDIKGLLFDSWLNGTNKMAALGKLPGRKRVRSQLEKMTVTAGLNCQ